jgi:hypothetical protein
MQLLQLLRQCGDVRQFLLDVAGWYTQVVLYIPAGYRHNRAWPIPDNLFQQPLLPIQLPLVLQQSFLQLPNSLVVFADLQV